MLTESQFYQKVAEWGILGPSKESSLQAEQLTTSTSSETEPLAPDRTYGGLQTVAEKRQRSPLGDSHLEMTLHFGGAAFCSTDSTTETSGSKDAYSQPCVWPGALGLQPRDHNRRDAAHHQLPFRKTPPRPGHGLAPTPQTKSCSGKEKATMRRQAR